MYLFPTEVKQGKALSYFRSEMKMTKGRRREGTVCSVLQEALALGPVGKG